MLRIQFDGVSPACSCNVESKFFRVGGTITTDADGAIVAEVQRGSWTVAGELHTRWTCSGPVDVHFEFANGQESEKRGTFPFLSVFGGAMRDGEYLATLDDGIWRCFRTRAELKGIILS